MIGIIASTNPRHFTALAVTTKDLTIGATALAALFGMVIAVRYLAPWVAYPEPPGLTFAIPQSAPCAGLSLAAFWCSPLQSPLSGPRCCPSTRCRRSLCPGIPSAAIGSTLDALTSMSCPTSSPSPKPDGWRPVFTRILQSSTGV